MQIQEEQLDRNHTQSIEQLSKEHEEWKEDFFRSQNKEKDEITSSNENQLEALQTSLDECRSKSKKELEEYVNAKRDADDIIRISKDAGASFPKRRGSNLILSYLVQSMREAIDSSLDELEKAKAMRKQNEQIHRGSDREYEKRKQLQNQIEEMKGHVREWSCMSCH